MKKKTGKVSINSKNQSVGKADHVDKSYVQAFEMLIENKEFMLQFIDIFPAQIEIFTPDGTAIFTNRAGLEFNNIPYADLIVGKYNVLNDPVLNDQMGLRDIIHKAFKGEKVSGIYSPPIQDLVDRGIIDKKPYESAVLYFYFYPIWKNRELVYVISVCIVKNVYQGRADLAKAKEYIDTHWLGEYNKEEIAAAINMSVTQLYRLFKEHIGITPGDYHKKVKVEHIKEKLINKNLSIKEAFAACGEDSRGWILQAFKKITGMTPKQYRENLL